MSDDKALRFRLTMPQWEMWHAAERYIDLEGAVRAGKTTIPLLKIIDMCQNNPGMFWLACRWTQSDTDAQLKPRFLELCPADVLLPWNAKEQYHEVRTKGDPSRIYFRGLKPSQEHARYSKFAGLTLAGLYIDQPEELPEDFWTALKARLSQPGYPQRAILTPNPPAEGHWLDREFPTDNSRLSSGYRYIRTTVYDNREVLGESYIAALEEAYPVGTALRRRFIEGRRGLSAVGEPVYKGYFKRDTHEDQDLTMNKELPLIEAWDFGFHRPCVVWAQFTPWGSLDFLGGVMGESIFIEDFAPAAIHIRELWFPNPLELKRTCDPAGTVESSQGTSVKATDAITVLDGVEFVTLPNANSTEARKTANDAIAGYMQRMTGHGPAFRVGAKFMIIGGNGYQRSQNVLVDGFEAGYVRDPRTGRPKKDGFYEHSQNCCEYVMLMFGPGLRRGKKKDATKTPDREGGFDYDPRLRGQGWMG